MSGPQLIGVLAYFLVALTGIAFTAVYAYHAWTAPDKLRRTALRNLDSGMFRWWPFRDASRQWIDTPSYIWLVRIGTLLVLVAFVAIIVALILLAAGVL